MPEAPVDILGDADYLFGQDEEVKALRDTLGAEILSIKFPQKPEGASDEGGVRRLVASGPGVFAQTNAVPFPTARPAPPPLSLKDRPEIGRYSTRAVLRDAKELFLVRGLPDPMPGSVLGLLLHTLRDGQRALGEDGPLNRTEWKDYYQALARAHGRMPMTATNAPGVTNTP